MSLLREEVNCTEPIPLYIIIWVDILRVIVLAIFILPAYPKQGGYLYKEYHSNAQLL
jgi:hypothetical protein